LDRVNRTEEFSMSQHPIADYALVADCNGSALISRDGSIDWLCMPRFDSPSVLARLLDDRAGHWSLRLDGEVTAERRYLDQTMVLQTTFRTSAGTVTVTDAMALGPDERGHELGKDVPHALLRSVTCESGRAQLALEFAPRPGYGVDVSRIVPELGGAIARGGEDQFALSAPVPLSVEAGTAYARLQLEAGQRVGFALQYAAAGQPAKLWTQREIQAGLEDTIQGWRSWSAIHQSYKGPWQDLVLHSGRVLQALMYTPTGAIVAAPTTSLPRQSAAPGIGTTGTSGSATPRSRSERCGWRRARTRPAASSPSWSGQPQRTSAPAPRCRSCSGSTADTN
jgi:GH15 family glucan-1,4-alpha-glucosidase